MEVAQDRLTTGIAYVCSLLTGLFAALILLTWRMGSPALLAPVPWQVPMQFNSALGELFAALGLGLLAMRQNWWSRALALLAIALTFTLSVATMAEYVLRRNLGVDQLFVPDALAHLYTGRMSFITTLGLLLIGMAELGLLLGIQRSVARLIVIVPAGAAFFAVSGYLSAGPVYYDLPQYSLMTPHTAACFILLSLGLVCAGPHEGFMALLWTDGPAGRALRVLIPGTMVLPAVLGLVLRIHLHYGFSLQAAVAGLMMVNTTCFLLLLWWVLGRLHASEVMSQSINQALVDNDNTYAQQLEHTVQERTKALEASLTRTRAILEHSSDGICGVDLQGAINFLNPAAEHMLRVDAQHVIGKQAGDLFHIRGRDGLAVDPDTGLFGEALRKGVAVRAENQTLWRADYTSFPVECVATPIYVRQQLQGAMMTFRDVSERNKVERIKSEFVSVVSHELRTPLTSIRGALGLLASGKLLPLTSPAQSMVDVAVRNTDRLTRLINDILDVERLEGAPMRLRHVQSTSSELVRQAADAVRVFADQAAVTISYQVEHVVLRVDVDRIVQVITNLLANAIKFSDKGSTVTLGCVQEPGCFHFTVRDTGQGIDADKISIIFERFQQADCSDVRSKGGSGLGLTIARAIVRQHGGNIWVESQRGKGSTFHFTLPQRRRADHTGQIPLVLS